VALPRQVDGGEPLDAVEVSWHGLAGDRRWAFVREAVRGSGFPWLTIRQRSDLCRFRPVLTEPEDPDRSTVAVATPNGERFDVTDPVLAARLGHGARALKQDRGSFDAAPVSLVTTQTVERLAALTGRDADALRFRPNLVVRAAGDAPFAEDAWVGTTLRAGDLRLRVDRRDSRCVVVDVDPRTAQREPGSCGRSRASTMPASASTQHGRAGPGRRRRRRHAAPPGLTVSPPARPTAATRAPPRTPPGRAPGRRARRARARNGSSSIRRNAGSTRVSCPAARQMRSSPSGAVIPSANTSARCSGSHSGVSCIPRPSCRATRPAGQLVVAPDRLERRPRQVARPEQRRPEAPARRTSARAGRRRARGRA
jgi:uncharacterized protein YcbX